MLDLYIDFDGVILDTMEETNKMAKKQNIDMTKERELRKFYASLDWDLLLTSTAVINDSLNCIQKIIDSNKFNVSILTHVNSLHEGVAKIQYIRQYFNDITIIMVPISVSKTKMVHTEGTILIDDRLSNLLEWKSENGIPILFSKTSISSQFKCINKLDEVIEMFDI